MPVFLTPELRRAVYGRDGGEVDPWSWPSPLPKPGPAVPKVPRPNPNFPGGLRPPKKSGRPARPVA